MTGFGSESYTYDAYGNLTANGATPLTTDPATNRLNAGVTGATYDAAGNLTSLGFTPNVTTYTYDDLNQLASVSGGGINRSQAYTADGERLFVRDGTTYLFTLRDLGGNVVREYEYTAAGGWRWKRDNVYRGGLLLASQGREEGIQHYHLDHLGSPRLVTSRTGEQLRLFATSPYGKDPTATQSSERMRFTVHERDLGSLTDTLDDIDYMHARSYSPRLGRFTGVDLLRGNPFNPQTMGLYGYVVSNPTNHVDPSGLLPASGEGDPPVGVVVEDVTVTGDEPIPDSYRLYLLRRRFTRRVRLLSLPETTYPRPPSPVPLPSPLPPEAQAAVARMEQAYDEWFQSPLLPLGQQDGAKYWGPIGNAVYLASGFRRGSSCLAWALGLHIALKPHHTELVRTEVGQRWVPVPHSFVIVQWRETASGSWHIYGTFDPFWRIR